MSSRERLLRLTASAAPLWLLLACSSEPSGGPGSVPVFDRAGADPAGATSTVTGPGNDTGAGMGGAMTPPAISPGLMTPDMPSPGPVMEPAAPTPGEPAIDPQPTPDQPADRPDGTQGQDQPMLPEPEALDCGPDGWVVENHGPPANRVNYLILADGYNDTTVDTVLEQHIRRALDVRFNQEKGEPYGRYRKFVNICVAKVVSQSDGIGNGPTAFSGGNGGDRLARVDQRAVTEYINANIPETFEIDWSAVVLNQDLWENTGSILMLWSGGNRDAAGAALHEGGHGFHQLADEYCAGATGTRCGQNMCAGGGREYPEVNTTANCDTTAGKWDLWLGDVQKGLKVPDMGATGVQGTFVGSRYEDSGQYRPSGNSMMNSLFGDNVNTSYNAVSREQIIFSIWRAVRPVDSTDPPEGDVSSPGKLQVNVIDPEVINVDWSVDGELVAENGGIVFDVQAENLASGTHTISARAYDNASEDLVRNRSAECPSSVTGHYCHGTAWSRSEQTVSWTVTRGHDPPL